MMIMMMMMVSFVYFTAFICTSLFFLAKITITTGNFLETCQGNCFSLFFFFKLYMECFPPTPTPNVEPARTIQSRGKNPN